MDSEKKASHRGFIRGSGVFIFFMFLGNVFEIGFTGLTARLPGTGYETFNALFNIFFIAVAPLYGIQFMVGKEVSSYNALGETGKVRTFVERTFQYVLFSSLIIMVLGFALSPLIAGFLRIESISPVVLLMIMFVCYSPFPVFYGTVQGLKKFTALGFLHLGWGFLRFFAAACVIFILSQGLTGLLLGVTGAVLVATVTAWFTARSVFHQPRAMIEHKEIKKAYSLVLPIIVTLFFVMVLKNADIIFAKRFFDPVSAKAYTCAARVGSGFFTLSGIIIVMLPHVSEENTRRGNPIVFLVKSFIVTIGLSLVGLLVAWYTPDLVMNVITLGKYIEGAEKLIRFIGLAIIPLSLVYIMSNYLLAKHRWGFLPILICGVLLQILLIYLMQQTPLRMLSGIALANTTTFLVMLAYVIKEHRHYMKNSYNGSGI